MSKPLTPRQQQAYDLRSEGKTLQQVADTMGLTREGVRQLVGRARHKLGLPAEIMEESCTCLRCAASWTPRTKKPVQCPRCKSPFWDRPRKKGE